MARPRLPHGYQPTRLRARDTYSGLTMRLRTLGGLSLEGSAFARPKPLLLLAYLALEGPASRRRLAELFWPQARNPRKSLSVALVRLRQGAPGSVDADVQLVWTHVDADAVSFLQRLERQRFADALELYRGPFLRDAETGAGVELEEWIVDTRDVFADHAQWAHLERAEAAAARGDFEVAATHAEAAFAEAPATPEPDRLARIHDLMLAGRSPQVPWVRRQATPFDVPLAPSTDAARRRFRGDPRGLAPGRHDLAPAQVLGRDEDRRALVEALQDPAVRLVTLTGPAGVGKSFLAARLAADTADGGAFPAGVHAVHLDAVRAPERLPDALAGALGVDAAQADRTVAKAIASLGGGAHLLVLDDFDHLVPAAPALAEVLHACPDVTVLVTSRERLHLPEEQAWPLGGLAYPDAPATSAADASTYGAVQLFVREARRANPRFELTDAETPAVVAICRAVEGLPLALRLAAGWAHILPPADIASQLQAGPELLRTPTRDTSERHRSMQAAFDHTWHLLTPGERAVARALAVFRGGFRRDAAREVAGATIPVLASLADKSLLRMDRRGRFDRHPLLWQFMADRLASLPEERARIEARHGRFYMRFLETHADALAGSGQHEALAAVTEERDNVHAAWRWALATGARDALWQGCRPLQLFYIQRGGPDAEAARLFGEAAEALGEGDHGGRVLLGRLRVAEAWFRFRLREHEVAERACRDGLEALRAARRGTGGAGISDEDETVARALASGLNTLGNLTRARGDYQGALATYGEAMELAQAAGLEAQVALFLNNLASVRTDLGQYEDAERLYREAVSLNRRRGNDRSVVRNLANLGQALVRAGEPERAEDALREGRRAARACGYDAIEPDLAANLGHAALARGELRAARKHFEDALARRDDGAFGPDLRHQLGRVAAAEGDPAAARRHYRAALEAALAGGHDALARTTLLALAEVHAERGAPERAARLLGSVRDHPGLTADERRRLRDLERSLPSGARGAPERRGPGGSPADLRAAIEEALRDTAVP